MIISIENLKRKKGQDYNQIQYQTFYTKTCIDRVKSNCDLRIPDPARLSAHCYDHREQSVFPELRGHCALTPPEDRGLGVTGNPVQEDRHQQPRDSQVDSRMLCVLRKQKECS